jgi:hypothetical protein
MAGSWMHLWSVWCYFFAEHDGVVAAVEDDAPGQDDPEQTEQVGQCIFQASIEREYTSGYFFAAFAFIVRDRDVEIIAQQIELGWWRHAVDQAVSQAPRVLRVSSTQH